MKKKNVEVRKIFFLLVLAFFVAFFSFSVYTVLSGIISFGELEGWDGETVATSFTAGNGSEENPYVIHNAEEFMYFKSLIEGDTYESYQDMNYVLDSNIDFGGYDITPIGISTEDVERIFTGVFDGKGYTLMNFKIREASVLGDTSYFALFSKIQDGEIYRINLDNYRIEVPEGNDAVISGLVGDIQTGVLENVSLRNFNIRVKHQESTIIGIIAGNSEDAKIRNFYVNGEIDDTDNNIVRYYDKGEANTIISDIDYKGTILNSNVTDLYLVQNHIITLNNEEVNSESLLEILSDGLDFD